MQITHIPCLADNYAYIINDKKLYPRNYHYRPGITKEIIINFDDYLGGGCDLFQGTNAYNS